MSNDDEILDLQGLGGKGGSRKKVRYPVEDPEGVVVGDDLFTSLTKIQAVDLLCEGEIEGLVTGRRTYVGTKGNIGWTSAAETVYANAPNTTNRWLRSLYWNDVPVVNSSNQFNYSEVDVSFTRGLPNGASILLDNETTYSRGIGERLRFGDDFEKRYRINNRNIKAIEVNIRLNQLSETNVTKEEYGDIERSTISWAIRAKPIYSTPGKTPTSYPIATSETVHGKISYGYIRSTRINLFETYNINTDDDFVGWEVHIRRLDPDAISNNVRNATFVDSITEVYGDQFTYPNSALVSATFSAENFSQVPARSFEAKGLKVLVPSNYDPKTRSYTDADDWDGTFHEVKQWTDNPAWCFYDLLTNRRYGLGQYLNSNDFDNTSLVDKWTLYEIGKYCDTLVEDGLGGLEPRFSCNLYINTQEEAYKVVNNVASIFNAITYYNAGSIYTVQDHLQSTTGAAYQFTNANIEDGNFQYSSSSKRARHTVAIVRYNDKNNLYKPALEYVEDLAGIRKYGIRELDLVAFGCTSRGQALRMGRWALLSETLETESVSFTAGLEAAYLRPGDVIKVMDSNRKAQRYGGRTYKLNAADEITLDSRVTGLANDQLYYLSLLTPTYNYDPSFVNITSSESYPDIRRSQLQVKAFLGSVAADEVGADNITRTKITLPNAFDVANYSWTGNLVWMIESSGVADTTYNQFDYFRVIHIEEQPDYKFNVNGLEYAVDKFNLIESGVSFQDTAFNNAAPPGPSSLVLSPPNSLTTYIDYTFTVPDKKDISNYLVFVNTSPITASNVTNREYIVNTLKPDITNGTYYPTAEGTYYFRVHSINKVGIVSENYAEADKSIGDISATKDIVISSLMLSDADGTNEAGTRNTDIFEESAPNFKWAVSTQSNLAFPSDIAYRVSIREPSTSNQPSPHIYFQELDVLKSRTSNLVYEFTIEDNIAAVSNQGVRGPFRDFDVVVDAHLEDGESSAGGTVSATQDSNFANPNGYDILGVTNERPSILLTDPENGITDPEFTTDQWISQDGDIKIKITVGEVPDDLEQAYLYYSENPFTVPQAYDYENAPFTITRANLDSISNNSISFNTNLVNSSKVYIAVALIDTFDVALIDQGKNVNDLIKISNVVAIVKRGGVDTASVFHSWIEIDANGLSIPLNWKSKSYNIATYAITRVRETATGFIHDGYIDFTDAMSNTNYAVMGSVAYITTRETNRIHFANLPNGKHFFGVLWNSNVA